MNKLEGRFTHRLARLDQLNNWGVLAWRYPHASATKLAHHYGLEWNAMQFLDGGGEREKYRASLRTAAHVLHWGHLPLSYAAEEAVLRAAHVDSGVAGVLDRLMDEVIIAGELRCEDEGHDCVSGITSGERPFELYRWLSAWLVKRNWSRIWTVVKDASDAQLDEADTRKQLLRTLVCRADRGFRVLSLCNEADYVPRDLLQAGTAWLTVDIGALWETNPLGSDAAREWSLVHAARSYLDARFFQVPDSVLVHSLAARAIAGGLLADGFSHRTLETLLASGDDYFSRKLKPYHRQRLGAVREVARSGRLQSRWSHVGSFADVSLDEGSRFAMEDQLTRRTGRQRVTYPFSSGLHVQVDVGATAFREEFAGDGRQYATVHVHHGAGRTGEETTARQVLDVVAVIAKRSPPTNAVGDAVLSWLIGGVVEQRSPRVSRVCREIYSARSRDIGKAVARIIRLAGLTEVMDHQLVGALISGFADAPSTARQQQTRVAHLLLRLPWRGLKSGGGRELLRLIRSEALQRVTAGARGSRGYALETAAVADQWLAPGDPQERFIFTGATLLGKDGLPAQEWDIVRLDLYGRDEWTLTAVECAVRRTAEKDSDARDKLELLRTRLEDRFADLMTYRTLLVTAREARLRYRDAGRGFAPT